MMMTTTDKHKLQLIDALRRLQRHAGGDVWFSLSAIQTEAGMGYPAAKAAITVMMTEGWLHARHRMDNPEKIIYRLRDEYR